jgi:hypothetical protein
LFDDEVAVTRDIRARITVRRSARPLPPGVSRATRVGGLVVRSGRAAHESTFASHEGSPGTRSLYGEVRCDALEELQRDALERPRPQVVVKVDRTGLNDNHPVVKALYAAIDRVLRPLVAAEEQRARAHLVRPGGALRARDQVGLRALNDALKGAFDMPGKAGFESGGTPSRQAPLAAGDRSERQGPREEGRSSLPEPAGLSAPLRFKQALIRLHPGERRGISLLVDPERIPPGTPVHVAVRGPARVQGARARRSALRSIEGARARVPPLPDAGGRGRGQHRVLVGRRRDPRPPTRRGAPD